LSARLNQYYGRLRRPPGQPSTSRFRPVIGRHAPAAQTRRLPGRGGPPQFPPPPSIRSAPPTPGSSSRLRFQALHRFHGLHPDYGGSALPCPALNRREWLRRRRLRVMLRTASSLPLYRALDAGLRPGPFPGRAASLLPGLLAATRTGLPPAGDDELTNTKIHHGTRSRLHLPPYWAHITGHYRSSLVGCSLLPLVRR
jgi:hypothetical protein